MKAIILAYILASLASQAHGKCDGVITVAMFADEEFMNSLGNLNIDLMDVAKVLTTNVQQYFLAERFGGKGVLLEVITVSELPKDVAGSDDADEYLDNFCKAQASFMDSGMWDHAMLLSFKDLRIKGEGNDTKAIRGIGNPGSMCGPQEEKCSIIKLKDLGLNTGVVTAAQEIGRSLGLSFDEKTDCKSKPGIMTESINFKSLEWSSCSIKAIEAIFNENKLPCLMKDEIGNDILKDRVFDPISHEKQCHLGYGSSFEPFNGVVAGNQVDVCENLYCKETNIDIVFAHEGSPSLGGTKCGNGKKCWNQECVDLNNFDPDVTCREPEPEPDNGLEDQVVKIIKSISECLIQIVKDFFSLFRR